MAGALSGSHAARARARPATGAPCGRLWPRAQPSGPRRALRPALAETPAAPEAAAQQQQQQQQRAPPSSELNRSGMVVNMWVQQAKQSRSKWLQEHSLEALQTAVSTYEHPVFPCALIAGDVVILDLLARLGCLADGRVAVVFVDTHHLFPETHAFLSRLEEKYGFQAQRFSAKGFATKEEFKAAHGSDLFLTDPEAYDRTCKVEPFNRALVKTQADVMINGRRQDHGFERARLEVFEDGRPVKCNPLAWWTFRDCFDYLESRGLEAHPLHAQGYPSVGDVHSTIPVPPEKWFDYAGERAGRFQGMTNRDGSLKTECGIHVPGGDESTGLSNIRK